jgi:hypothetical protein
MEVAVDDACRTLSRETATMVYRVVEEMLEAFEAPRSAAVRARAGELRLAVCGSEGDRPRADRLATIAARVELLGGGLERDGVVLRLRIPVPA